MPVPLAQGRRRPLSRKPTQGLSRDGAHAQPPRPGGRPRLVDRGQVPRPVLGRRREARVSSEHHVVGHPRRALLLDALDEPRPRRQVFVVVVPSRAAVLIVGRLAPRAADAAAADRRSAAGPGQQKGASMPLQLECFQKKRPSFETLKRDDHSSKDQPKRVENDRDRSL